MKRFLVLMVGVAFSVSVQHAVWAQDWSLNSPYTNSFELYTEGDSVTNNVDIGQCWKVPEDDIAFATVTNLSYSGPYAFNPTNVNHDRVLNFDAVNGTVETRFTNSPPVVWIDSVVQPVFTPTDQESPVTNAQLAVRFVADEQDESIGYISIYHGAFSGPASYGSQGDTNRWTTFQDSPVTNGAWVRITIAMHMGADALGSFSAFQIMKNGVLLSNAWGYVTLDEPFTPTGSWFRCTASDATSTFRLNSLALAGTGKLDDLLVSADQPDMTLWGGAEQPPDPYVTWLTQFNLATNSPPDADDDGASNWAEWLAGTNPTNDTSVLEITRHVVSNNTPYVSWVSTVQRPGGPYLIQWSTNLVHGVWHDDSTNNDVSGTTVTAPIGTPLTPPAFFRINLSTNMP